MTAILAHVNTARTAQYAENQTCETQSYQIRQLDSDAQALLPEARERDSFQALVFFNKGILVYYTSSLAQLYYLFY